MFKCTLAFIVIGMFLIVFTTYDDKGLNEFAFIVGLRERAKNND